MSSPSTIPLDLENALRRRREAVQAEWKLDGEVVLIAAGDPVPIPGRADLTYRFRSHSEYFYLTDSERSGGVLAFDPLEGWIDFVRPISRAERLWEGAPPGPAPGRAVSELESWLEQRAGRPLATLGAALPGVSGQTELTDRLRRGLNQVRRPKDPIELERIRAAAQATAAGFATATRLLEPGRTERELQIELEASFYRAGADGLAFETIVASGANSAVLHFPPTDRRLAEGELVLIDAGAEYRGYAGDVTRTYAVSGSLTSEQAAIYDIVHRALERGVEASVVGAIPREVHLAAARVIAEGLSEFGLLSGTPDSLVEQGAVSMFFPHGVGHLVGLGARDASETRPERRTDPSTPGLRTDMRLGAGFVTTVEPGVYFVPALLEDMEARERLGPAVNWERAEAMIGFGGIRLEQDVLVTDDGPQVLTAEIPLLD